VTCSGDLAKLAAAGAMAAYVAAVALAGMLDVDAYPLASSPAGVGRGEIAQVLTSALPVSGPWPPALLLLAGSGLLAARAAGPQRAVAAGLLAHLAGTLIPYAALALARLHTPHAWDGDWHTPDYGVSLVFGAWFALAAVRAPSRATAIATGLLALALARPGMTLTGAEHGCALAIGAACGVRGVRKPLSRLPRSRAPVPLSR
jgi:hypothetical protein